MCKTYHFSLSLLNCKQTLKVPLQPTFFIVHKLLLSLPHTTKLQLGDFLTVSNVPFEIIDILSSFINTVFGVFS